MKGYKKGKKSLGIVVASAAVISVGSVGFASWIISGGDSSTMDKAIGVDVATISDERIKLSSATYTNTCVANGTGVDANVSSKTLVDNKTNPTTAYIVFGPYSSDTTGLIQASGTGLDDIGHLSVSFQFTMSCQSNDILAKRLKKITITPTYPTILTELATADSNGKAYIYNPSSTSDAKVTLYDVSSATAKYDGNSAVTGTISGTNTGNFTYTIGIATGGKATIDITANWKWGSIFNGVNPGSLDSSESQANSVLSEIETINSLVKDSTAYPDKNVKFVVEVTADNTAS